MTNSDYSAEVGKPGSYGFLASTHNAGHHGVMALS